MRAEQLISKWTARGTEYRDVSARVDGSALAGEVVRDLTGLMSEQPEELLTVAEAAEASGYTPQHLRRLIEKGAIRCAGTGRERRVPRSELPLKPGRVAREKPSLQLVGATAEQAVRNSVGASTGNPR